MPQRSVDGLTQTTPPGEKRMTWKKFLLFVALTLRATFYALAQGSVDSITFGDATSERGHGFTQMQSEVVRGGLGEPARQLLPLDPVSYNGGWVSFMLKVDPVKQNYFTVKLWGSDKGEGRGRLILYIDGLQVGYRHEGDYDVLNQCDEEAINQGRFLYQTVPLPLMHTQGKSTVTLKIAGLGSMFPYGVNFAALQHKLSMPTRGIYRAYVSTETEFTPDASEHQGTYHQPSPRPAVGGEQILEQMRKTVNGRLTQLLDAKIIEGRAAEENMHLLAEAYNIPWTAAYHNDRAVETIIREGDAFVRTGNLDPQEWLGAGPFGEAIARLGKNPLLMKALDETIEVPSRLHGEEAAVPNVSTANASGGPATARMTRRAAWAHALRYSVDGHRLRGRRAYTNQSMIVDYNIYAANRGLMIVDPSQALPEKQALRYLYEAIGILPWLGNDTNSGGSEQPYGRHYYLVTQKGLSRELGYVGTYGETILKFGRDMADLSGDQEVLQQLVKIEDNRLYFRYPSIDPDGYRTMKIAGEIDARTAHFPVSQGAYTGANVAELWWMEVPAITKDPKSVGAALQSLDDGQYFYRLALKNNDRDTLGMMRNINEYAVVKALPASAYRLPMTEGQPDFVYADPEDAVIAVKHGEHRLFLNFYFRQEFGVSGAVRILDESPDVMRIATVKSHTEVIPSGHVWIRPDVIDFERSGGFPPPGEVIHQAWQGEQLPISKRPDDASQPQYENWGPFVGKAAFYWLRYGDYLFAINTTEDNTYALALPEGNGSATDLIAGKHVDLGNGMKVGPQTTVVLYLGK